MGIGRTEETTCQTTWVLEITHTDTQLTACLETCAKSEWLALVSPSLQHRIAQYSEEELRFNLLAVVPERPDGVASATGDGSYEDIAQRRKFDYEAFAHKVAMMLTKNQIVGAGLV